MILSKHAYIKISPRNHSYWKTRGYQLRSTGGRGGKNTGQRIKVSVNELAPNSNVRVACRCDDCGNKYLNRYSRKLDICSHCHLVKNAAGNTWGTANRGKSLPSMRGENHPRWNPDKSDFLIYSRKVRYLSEQEYEKHIDWINPTRKIRTLCGKMGGYQLDHKISVKRGFELGIDVVMLSKFHNLQMLSWEANLNKSAK